MYLGHVSGRKVVPDCRRLGSSASDCRLQKGYPLCECVLASTLTPGGLTELSLFKLLLIFCDY